MVASVGRWAVLTLLIYDAWTSKPLNQHQAIYSGSRFQSRPPSPTPIFIRTRTHIFKLLPPSAPSISVCSTLLLIPQFAAYLCCRLRCAHGRRSRADDSPRAPASPSLPIRVNVRFHGAAANKAMKVWFCVCCDRYHRIEAGLVQHLQATAPLPSSIWRARSDFGGTIGRTVSRP